VGLIIGPNLSAEVTENLINTKYTWFFMEQSYDFDNVLKNHDDIIIVSETHKISDFCAMPLSTKKIKGFINKDFLLSHSYFISEMDSAVNMKITSVNVKPDTYADFIKQVKTIIQKDEWSRVMLFLEEILPNVFMHAHQQIAKVDIWEMTDGTIKVDIQDDAGKLDADIILNAIKPFEGFGPGNEDIKIGGHGLRLIISFTSFVSFSILPKKFTKISGYFSIGKTGCGFLISTQEEKNGNKY